ncbi:hypothetical protein RGI86_002217 [Morganella morganii]|nr:hypothetical protein [Morganella morganii]
MSLKQINPDEIKRKYEDLGRLLEVDNRHFIFHLDDEEIDLYEISRSTCNTPEQLLEWVFHLTEKRWMTMDLLRYFIQVASEKSNINIR